MIETPTETPDLYHFTCWHKSERIIDTGKVMPVARLASPAMRLALRVTPLLRWSSQVCWLTTVNDLPSDHREPCTWESLCDRTEYRFAVNPHQDVHPWVSVRGGWPDDVVTELEARAGTPPESWWLSGGLVRVTLAPRGVPATA